MAVFVDSDVLIDYLKGDAAAVKRMENALKGDPPLVVPSIVFYEVLCGNERETRLVRQFSEKVVVAPFRKESAEVAASLFKALRARGMELPMADLAIAGTVLASTDGKAGSLLTNNKRHFGRIPGLRVL